MKSKIWIILIAVILLLMVACTTKSSTNLDDDLNDQNEVEDNDDGKVETMYVNGTKTIQAHQLWQQKDATKVVNLTLDEDQHITLNDHSSLATYESLAIELAKFDELVLSWNVKNLGEARLTFFVSLGDGTNFGAFQNMGLFKDENHMSFNADHDFSTVQIDTLKNKNPNQYTMIKLRVNILPNSAHNLKLENISVTTKKVDTSLKFDESILKNKVIDVPPLQQLSIPSIGNVICSPTSVAMVLNHYGYTFTQQEIAKKVYDNSRSIYGNWTFNASYAGSLDNIWSRVEYIDDFKTVVNYILNDIPVVFSITTTSLDQLTGSIMAFPAGHLVVLKGFEEVDGIWYGIFNDPAAYEDSKVERKYSLSQVLNVWRQYTYIIVEQPNDLN